jgi:DNA processing protein
MAVMVQEQETFYQIALASIPGIGPVVGRSMVGYCGSAEAVFKESKFRLSKIPGVGDNLSAVIHKFQSFETAEHEFEFISKNKIRTLFFTSPDYPLRLKQIPDSPLLLFVKGNTNLNHARYLAIVGTRKNTFAGEDFTNKLVEELKAYNVHIISGLAYGIDICAHKASLKNQIPTLGVVGHGLDLLYPGQHASYARQMVENDGAIISEFFSGTALNKDLFPRRNRIVAGLCDALVVVESMTTGGSLITADIANSYNKDVFAVPGRPTDPMSTGCNQLIKQLKAHVCVSAADISKEMNWDTNANQPQTDLIQTSLLFQMSPDEKAVVDFLSKNDAFYDAILAETNIPVSKLSLLLIDLEMKGILRSKPGKLYGLCR